MDVTNTQIEADAVATLLAGAVSNRDGAMNDIIATMEAFGGHIAIGKAGLTEAAMFWGAECGSPNSPTNDADAERVYKALAAGHNAHVRSGEAEMPTDEKSIKSAVSIFRTFGKVGVLGRSFWLQVLTVRAAMAPETLKVKSAYNALVTANRRALDYAKENNLPTLNGVRFADEMVRDWLTKGETEDKSEAQKLAAAAKAFLALVGNAERPWVGTCLPEIAAEVEQFILAALQGRNEVDRAKIVASVAKVG